MSDRRTMMIGRDATIRSSSFNVAENTVEIVFTTGATVRRFSYAEGSYDEELVVSHDSVRLGRLNAGAPFLNTHDDKELRSVIGSVVPGSARIENGLGICTIRLSRRADIAGIVMDIRDGVIRNVSVGYRYHKIEKTAARDGSTAHWRVIDWEPLEISAVPIPADPGAQVRSGPTSAPTNPPLIRETRSMTQTATSRVLGPANAEKRSAAISNALLHRARCDEVKLTDDGRDFAVLDLIDLARVSLEAEGISTRGLDKLELADRALAGASRSGGMQSSSDFPAILRNVANKSMLAGYEAEPQTFRPLVRVVDAKDFRPITRVQMGEAPPLLRVGEHGEFKRGTIGESKVEYALATYGRICGFTRQALINDDLDALTKVPRFFGIQASALESDLVWSQIITNPVGSDGLPAFDAGHNNLGTASGINVLSVSEGIEAMRLQTGVDGRTRFNLIPKFIITTVAAALKAEQLIGSAVPDMVASQSNNVVPSSIRSLTPISEPRLDAGVIDPLTGAITAGDRFGWYLGADPARVDGIELAYLRGERGPQTETRNGFNIDGVEFKIRLDAAAKLVDWRSFFKNPATAL